ncbi:MAG: fatty acid desaturase [Actinomycetota bacterium]
MVDGVRPTAKVILDEPAARRRIAELKLSTPQGVRSGAHLLLMWSAYAAGAVLTVHVHSWAVRLPVWFAMGWVLLGNGATVHETLHGHLFSGKRLNRAVGLLAGMSVGLPASVYGAYHLGHHQYSCTAKDPEGAPYLFTSRLYYLLLPVGGPLAALQFAAWTLQCAAGRAPVWVRSERQRRMAALDGLLGLVFFGAMAALGVVHFDLLLCVWLAPWLVTVVLLEPFVLVPEHYGAVETDAASALLTTRTVRSNPVVTWLYWGNNMHTAHHLHVGAVPQHIRRVTDEFVMPSIPDEWTASGYLSFHWRTFAGLPWLPNR